MNHASGGDRTAVKVQGSLVDVDGRPVRGERVYLVANRRVWHAHPDTLVLNGDEWIHLATATSDASGRYVISAEVEARRTRRLQLVVSPNDFAMTAAWICVPNQEMSPITLTPPCRIEGTICSPTGQPVAGANVRLASIDAMFHGCWQLDTREASRDHGRPLQAPYLPAPVTTDEDGKFTLSCVPQGAVAMLEVRADGYAAQPIQVATDVALDHFANPCEQWAQHPKARCLPPRFTYLLEPPLIIEGRVFDRSTGEPIPDIEVLMSGSLQECGVISPAYGRSRVDGTYRIAVRPCDFYVTCAFAPLGHFQYLQSVMGTDVSSRTTSLGAFRLDFPVGRGLVIRGRVVDETTGEPIDGASVVYVRCRNPRPANFHDCPEQARVLTDRSGEYRITVQPGRGAILAEAPPGEYVRRSWNSRGYLTDQHDPHGVAEIDVTDDADDAWRAADIALRRGVPLRLRITGPLGLPVAHGLVSCPELRERDSPRSDWRAFESGRLQFEGAEPNRSYCMLICSKGGRRGAVVEVVATSKSRSESVRLEPTAAIRGRLLHANGQPAAGIELFPKFWTNLRKMLTPDDESAVALKAEFYGNFEREIGDRVTRADGRFKIHSIVADLPMILCLNEQLASGLKVHPIGMLKPHENRNLGDLVLAN